MYTNNSSLSNLQTCTQTTVKTTLQNLTETLQLYGDDENPWLQAQHVPTTEQC